VNRECRYGNVEIVDHVIEEGTTWEFRASFALLEGTEVLPIEAIAGKCHESEWKFTVALANVIDMNISRYESDSAKNSERRQLTRISKWH
jgi:hypothetical protein